MQQGWSVDRPQPRRRDAALDRDGPKSPPEGNGFPMKYKYLIISTVFIVTVGITGGAVVEFVMSWVDGVEVSPGTYASRIVCMTLGLAAGIAACAALSQRFDPIVLLCGGLAGTTTVLHSTSPARAALMAAVFGATWGLAIRFRFPARRGDRVDEHRVENER